ncbi:hypothetical protein [Halothiobacillus sp.]|uniref:hypothetical protein n=1 Tax=Halothiobacillus sp. TaxID=1891311 RepID=UPI00260C4507|nr:hypothetical protein [Halothiobacillus sp.]
MKIPVTLIDLLRKQSSMYLPHLPDSIRIPALKLSRPDDVVRPVVDSTVDDVAFAIQGLEAESTAIHHRLGALRELYDGARKRGSSGSTTVAEAFADLVTGEARK